MDSNNKAVHDIIVGNLLMDSDLISELLVDSNGNYVVQKAIAVATGSYFIEMLTRISESMHLLQNVNFGSKLSQKLLTLYPEIKSIRHQDSRKIKYPNFNSQYQNDTKMSVKQGKQQLNSNVWNQTINFDYQTPPNYPAFQKHTSQLLNKSSNLK